jgi:hypothetical protein
MQTLLEAKYDLFENVDEMLAQQNLSRLLSKKIVKVQCYPMLSHRGLAGSHLSYVETEGQTLVLKRLSLESDWLMFTSDDHLCRSVTVWQYGLLNRLAPYVDHAIVACSRDVNGGAIVMRDLTDCLLGSTPQALPMTTTIITTFVDVLARLHATFWNDTTLDNPCLGLCEIAHHFDTCSLAVAQQHPNFAGSVIPEWIVEGWGVADAENLLEPDVKQILHSINTCPQPLFDALSRYPFTLIHGDFRAENIALPQPLKPVVLDWQVATRALMTIDLAWFMNYNRIRQLMNPEQMVGFYRTRLESYLGQGFEDTQWQAMLDLGYLYNALRSIGFAAYWWKYTDNQADRAMYEATLRGRNQQVRNGIRWL